MKKVIQITEAGKEYYHVSVNPNNGNLTVTSDIQKASIFDTEWDMTFIPKIKETIKRNYPTATIFVVNISIKIMNKPTPKKKPTVKLSIPDYRPGKPKKKSDLKRPASKILNKK
jgi:hypothetical protein